VPWFALEDSGKDTDQWIQELEIMKRKLEILGNKMSEMDLIIHILHNLPDEYETTIEILETESEMDEATLERVKEKLRSRYEKINKGSTMNEKALFVRDKYRKFKGNCNYCGIYGHRGSECKKKHHNKRSEAGSQERGQIFGGFCFLCKQKGHKVQDCPKNNMKKNEQVHISRENEIVLIGSEAQIKRTDVWIADFGATSHMVCEDLNNFDCKISNQHVIVGDGRCVKVNKTGKLKLSFHNNQGDKSEVLLEEVKYIPELKVNLFSILVALKKGAKVKFEETTRILEKDNKRIRFDHKIPMGAKMERKNDECLIISEKRR
jgi:gag-polypeptide of LTR copia-type